MQPRWRQAGLILLSTVAVWLAVAAYFHLVPLLQIHYFVFVFAGLAAVCVVAYLASVTWIERRRPSEFSPHGALSELCIGALTGLALFAVVMAILWVAGVYRLDGWGAFNAAQFALMVGFWLLIALEEEILWRGLAFRLCSKVVGTWGGLVLSAVLFSVKHFIDNPGASYGSFLGVLLAGILLGAAYAATGRLWLPIGLHFGWNFAEGTLFGTQVSGMDLGFSVTKGKLIGPNILTGGQFGPEATIVAWIVIVAATCCFVWRASRSKNAEPPIWSGVGTAKI
jgi:membrane protease YdiL (CAAX protease family)